MSDNTHFSPAPGFQPRRDGAGVQQNPVLYYTTRPFGVSLAAQTLPLLLLAPILIFQPDALIPAALVSLLTAWWMSTTFRFELTAEKLRLRLGPFGLGREVALSEIESVEALDITGKPLAWGRHAATGHVRFKLKNGEDLIVVGLADPVETADAAALLKRRQGQ